MATLEMPKPAELIKGLQSIPLGSISPNPNNPRKHIEPGPLRELAESIKAHGVRQPVLLRPNGDGHGKYELVCGERRWRASKLAGKADIPAIVDPDLTDRQALEIGILENLQRQDVHPLDEALGYDALLKMPAEKGQAMATVETIAATVGKSISYIYQRLKLTALIPAAEDALRENRITAGHAILIARLQPPDQMKALHESCSTVTDYQTKEKYVETASVRDLADWIRRNVMLSLETAPWELGTAALVPAAGPCNLCSKRSGANPALFSDVKSGDVCMDPVCFHKKETAFITLQESKAQDQVIREHPQKSSLNPITVKISTEYYCGDKQVHNKSGWRKAAKGSCDFLKTAVITDSRDHSKLGRIERVCLAKQSCKVHWPEYAANPDRLKSFTSADTKESRRQRDIEAAYTQGLVSRIYTGAKKALREDWNTIAESLWAGALGYDDEPIHAALGIPAGAHTLGKHLSTLTGAELQRFTIALAASASGPLGEIEAVAKRHNIQTAQIRKDAEALYPKKAAVAKSVKSKVKPAQKAKAKK